METRVEIAHRMRIEPIVCVETFAEVANKVVCDIACRVTEGC